ncbi:MAG: hypothetical protein JWO12_951 [Frankiales bacterium]|nr:hypothetical protein [Frankiales bacterium]
MDVDGVITAVNDAALRLSGRQMEDAVGDLLLARVPEGSREAAAAMLAALVRGERDVVDVERQIMHEDGTTHDALVSIAAIRGPDGQVRELSVCVQDVTGLRTAQRLADRERARWQSLSQNASDVALIVDTHLVAQYASPSLANLLGHENGDMVGTSLLDLVHGADRDRVATSLLALVADGGREVTMQFRVLNAAGEWRCVEQRALNLLLDPAVGGLVLNLTDVTAHQELERNLRQAVLYDRLTGLPNRALTIDRLEQALEHQGTTGQRCALLVIDLDHFSAINDAYGHAGGDIVLLWVAGQLTSHAGAGDTVGRYGPDQFAVLLRDLEDARDAEAFAEKIALVLNDSVPLGDGSVRVSACVGLAQGNLYGAEALVSAAEGALARAKMRGRASSAFHDEALGRSLDGRPLGAELADAIAGEQLTVHYQPVVELATGRISGFEALVRWPHPQLGMVAPDAFLPIAEVLGLHVAIDRWVLRKACMDARRWMTETGDGTLTIAVNVSPDRLLSTGFVDDVNEALTRARLSPTCLVLEVTETTVVTDLGLAAEVLSELCQIGVKVSIDDFGTGYSSMLQLRQLPFTKLKIDREFVRELPGSADDLAICASVINLATRLGVRSIAEGVETAEQAAALSSLGCEFGQGFLWSPGVDAVEALELLRANPWVACPSTRAVRSLQKAAQLTTDPDMATRVVQLSREGASLHTIAAHLNLDGHRTASGRRWHARTVARLLFDHDQA